MTDTIEIYGIIGAGGFGREVMPVARQMIAGFDDPRKHDLVFVADTLEELTVVNGHKVISESDFIALDAANKYFNIAIADCKARERISKKMLAANIQPFSIQASNAVIFDNNDIGEGAILCPFTTITSNARIGKFFHANIYSYVAHDCAIGDFVTFAPNVHCNGKVVIEDYAYIGTGAVIKDGTDEKPIIVGKGSVVGMGAVVTKNVPPFTTVVGNPAAELTRK
ncbi:MAG: acetyltransferase [Deltaproteobacteria bacterium SG8_13]|nr:MAG: acetyltransferase [Deltaproteobacteria bacterium SG8_13]